MVAAALVINFSLPTNQTFAAATSNSTGLVGSWVSQIFQQVWQKATKKAPTKPDNTEDSDRSNTRQPVETPKPDTGGNVGTHPGKDTDGNKEQSNVTLADKIIQTGEKYLGTPYQLGATSGQTRTFDCSSFTQYVYKQHGISLPRSSRQQAQVGTTIPRSQIKKGDLLFFKTSSSKGQIGHVAIYAGNNRVLHTWGPGGVRYDSLSTKWLDQGYITAKRVIK